AVLAIAAYLAINPLAIRTNPQAVCAGLAVVFVVSVAAGVVSLLRACWPETIEQIAARDSELLCGAPSNDSNAGH
ncbi:MAG: hypothetical protein AAGG46_02695, partial [Planctomycetota bacterium]